MSELKEIIEAINEVDHRCCTHQSRTCVQNDVLAHILREVTTHLGISPGAFDAHYEKLRNHYHSQYLDLVSQHSKNAAGNLDDRPMSAVDTGDAISPLFPRI